MIKDQDQSKIQLGYKREFFREELRKQDLQSQYRKKRTETRSTIQPADVRLNDLIPQLKWAFENQQQLYLRQLHQAAFFQICDVKDPSFSTNSNYLIENGYLNEVMRLFELKVGDMKEVFGVIANLCHSNLLKQDKTFQMFKQIMIPTAQLISHQIQRSDLEEILVFLANLSAWGNGVPDELINKYYILEYLEPFSNSQDSNLIRQLCCLYHAMFSNFKKELTMERRKQVLIVLFKIIKRDDADMIHLELLHSIASVYQPDLLVDDIVLSNKAPQFIFASLNGEYPDLSLQILVKMSASDNNDLLKELLYLNILDLVYQKYDDKVKIHRRSALQILGNLCFNDKHITNLVVFESRFPRILMRFMTDIDRIEKHHILVAMNNIMCTGDDKTFKKIIDLGWLHMIKGSLEGVNDNNNLVQIVEFLMRMLHHSRDTSDMFVRDIIQDQIYKDNQIKKLVEKYYNQTQDSTVEEQMNKFLVLLN